MSELAKIAAKQRPARRRSKLEPYLDDLRKLQKEGYSLEQLRSFLGEIGVSVSRQSIYDFLKRRGESPAAEIRERGKPGLGTELQAPRQGSNPLHALTTEPDALSHIPAAKFEVDEESKKGKT